MKYRNSRTGTGRLAQWWPVLLLLLVVLVPTACLVWFMTEAIRNERLAGRQKLEEAYRPHLPAARDRLEVYWQQKAEALDEFEEDTPGCVVFQRCVSSGLADSIVCYDAQGRLLYPGSSMVPESETDEYPAEWAQAERLERAGEDLLAAADGYAEVAEKTSSANLAARALQARARCLVRAGRPDAAIEVITEVLGQDKYRQAVDLQGRLIVADGELRALEVMGGRTHAGFRETADRLKQRLADYHDPALPAPQRRFLMKRLQTLLPKREADFPTLEAEELAAGFVEAQLPPGEGSVLMLLGWLQSQVPDGTKLPTSEAENLAARLVQPGPPPQEAPVLRASGTPHVWRLSSPAKIIPGTRRVVALFRTESVRRQKDAAIAPLQLPSALSVGLSPPDGEPTEEAVFHSLPAGRHLPGWRLTLSLRDDRSVDAAADARVAAYLWTGILVIAAISVLALLIARTLRRQVRLTRLRNNLVATVSHELKTPLSSIRLLVDTLLDAPQFNEQTVHEYLQLIAKENTRLSRLIDNFLAFSRMERNKHAFEFAEVRAAAVIDAVVEVVRERFHAPECRFEVEVAPDLPPFDADADAMVTALLNLLDNAQKYSGEKKHVVLRAYATNGNICFEVADNGVGLSRAASKKVFRRFYQVDRRVSRESGGVGLGLSIVQFIATAHGGTVRVRSRPGHGSTFTITVPTASTGSPISEGTPA